jgi:hypothetical protein
LGPAQCYSTNLLKPTAPGACSDRALVVTAPATELQSPRDRCHLPSRPRRAAHAAATPCAMPLAGARTLASRTRQLRGHRHLKALLSADRCRPAATSTPRAAHAAAARAPYPLAIGRRRSCSLLFPQLSSSSRHSARPHHRHFSPTTIDRRLWCFSDPIDPTRSIA